MYFAISGNREQHKPALKTLLPTLYSSKRIVYFQKLFEINFWVGEDVQELPSPCEIVRIHLHLQNWQSIQHLQTSDDRERTCPFHQ